MGLTQKLGTIPLAISTDTSNNVGIGGSPSGSYKLEVTGTAKVSTSAYFAIASGNVGIGTVSPTAIGAYKSLTLDGVDGSIIDLRFNGSGNGRVFTSSDTAVGLESLSTTLPLVFKTQNGSGSTIRMQITSAGSVLIGTGTQPSAIGVNDLLVLGKSGSASNAINFSNGSTTNWGYLLAQSNKMVLGTGSSSDIAFETNAGSERMRITSAGLVGINTTTPYSTLQVNGNVHRAWTSAGSSASPLSEEGFVYSEQTNSTALAGMWFENVFASSNGVAVIFKVRSNAAAVSEAMRISSAGEVLLGTSTTGYKLNVNGDINIPGANRIVFNNEPNTWGISARVTTSTTNLGTALKNIIYCGGGANEGFAIVGPSVAFEVKNNGNVYAAGTITAGTKPFLISHPLPNLKETHNLRHISVESPQAELIYRGKLTLVNGKAQANIDEIATMTEGTFEVLCREVQCFTTNESGWDLIKGKVIGNIIYIESQNPNSTDEISWMVIGERKDKFMMDTDITDENGKVLVESLKLIQPTMPSEPINQD